MFTVNPEPAGKARVRMAIPKGSLEEGTLELLRRAGYEVKGVYRSYRPWINDPEISLKILRPQEIPVLVSEGRYDLGITGLDWVLESDCDVKVLLDLKYGFVKIVLAVPKWWNVESFDELLSEKIEKGAPLRISTEYIGLTTRFVVGSKVYKRFFGEKKPVIVTPWWRTGENEKVRIILSFGATEAKPPEDADAIVDNTSTGITLRENNLKVIETITTSTAVLIVNKKSFENPVKREKIMDIACLLRGAVEAKDKLHIFMNVKEENLRKLLSRLPALKSPTIAPLAVKGWYSVNTVIDRDEFLKVLSEIRKLAQGLVIYEPRQVVPLEEEGE